MKYQIEDLLQDNKRQMCPYLLKMSKLQESKHLSTLIYQLK